MVVDEGPHDFISLKIEGTQASVNADGKMKSKLEMEDGEVMGNQREQVTERRRGVEEVDSDASGPTSFNGKRGLGAPSLPL